MTRYDHLIAKLREAAQPQRPQALKDAGYSEDEIFEQTVSVATVAGLSTSRSAVRPTGAMASASSSPRSSPRSTSYTL